MRRMNLVLLLAFLAFAGYAAALFFRLAEPVAPHGPGGEHDSAAADTTGAAASADVPHTLGGLTLTALEQGPEALAAMDRLHGKPLGLTDGYQAQYGQGAGMVMVWVARVADGDAADHLTDHMTKRINEGRSPFSRPEPLRHGGLTLYQTTGMNQLHLYYANGPRVIWAALPPDSSPALLDQVVSAF